MFLFRYFLNFEKLDRGEDSRRYQELLKWMTGVNSAFAGMLNGMLSDIRIQETMYKMLRQQSEQMHIEEAHESPCAGVTLEK